MEQLDVKSEDKIEVPAPRKFRKVVVNSPAPSTSKKPAVVTFKKINQPTQKIFLDEKKEEEYDPEFETNESQDNDNDEERVVIAEEGQY